MILKERAGELCGAAGSEIATLSELWSDVKHSSNVLGTVC